MPTTNLGRIGYVNKGNWVAGTYKRLDVVRHNGAAWSCRAATTTTQEPSSTATDWMILVQDGTGGGDVRVTSNDTTAGVLNAKITAGDNVTLSVLNAGGNEQLQVSVPDVATLTGAQTLSNKTVVGVTDTVYAASGTSLALSNANGMIQTWALTANSTLTDSLTSGQSVLLQVTPSTFTLTYPTTVWTKAGGGGTAPALFGAGKTNILFWKVGATLYGTHLGDA